MFCFLVTEGVNDEKYRKGFGGKSLSLLNSGKINPCRNNSEIVKDKVP